MKRISREQLKNKAEIARVLGDVSNVFVDTVEEILEESEELLDSLTHDALIYATVACLVEDFADEMVDPNGLQKILYCLKEEFDTSKSCQ